MIDLTTISPTTFAKGTQKGDGTITPLNIVKDMVDLLFKDIGKDKHIKEYKFIDICCKSGNFLREIYVRLMNHPDMISEYEDTTYRSEYILNNMLYGICFRQTDTMLSTRNVYGRIVSDSHIICINGWEELVKTGNDKLTIDTLKEHIGFMKFDVVVGNPPYNNDLYLNFVQLSKKLAEHTVCMITPAKWQAKADDKNDEFRELVVPYMSNIVFYKDSTDAFNIQEWGGISYFILNSDLHNEKDIKIICTKNKSLETNYEKHDETIPVLYGRNILHIIGKAGTLGEGFKQSLYVKNTDHGEETIAGTLGFKRQIFVGEQERGESLQQAGYVEVMQGENVCGYKKISELFTTEKLNKWKCICSIMPGAVSAFDSNGKVLGMFKISIIGPNQVPKGSFPILKYFDTEEECNSFVSYCNTKLIAFLFYLGVCGTTLTKEFFRFVPDPGKFDHIFTDQELYEKYSLTEEEIAIIESVIKERKL